MKKLVISIALLSSLASIAIEGPLPVVENPIQVNIRFGFVRYLLLKFLIIWVIFMLIFLKDLE